MTQHCATTLHAMTLHYVDPHAKHSRRYAAMESFGRSRTGQFLSRRLLIRIDPWLYRTSRGRYPRVMGTIATAPLTSTGAKSGLRRVCQLAYFHDGAEPILIASNFAQPHHPGWYHNLKAHPECRLGDDEFAAQEVSDPAEYHRLYGLAERVYAGYTDYRVRTARLDRRIPIFRLTPR